MTIATRHWTAALCLSPLLVISLGCKPLKATSCMRQSDCNAGLICQSGQCVAPPSTGEEQSTGLRSDAQKSEAEGTKTSDLKCEGENPDSSCPTASSATLATSEGSDTRPPTGLVGGG